MQEFRLDPEPQLPLTFTSNTGGALGLAGRRGCRLPGHWRSGLEFGGAVSACGCELYLLVKSQEQRKVLLGSRHSWSFVEGVWRGGGKEEVGHPLPASLTSPVLRPSPSPSSSGCRLVGPCRGGQQAQGKELWGRYVHVRVVYTAGVCVGGTSLATHPVSWWSCGLITSGLCGLKGMVSWESGVTAGAGSGGLGGPLQPLYPFFPPPRGMSVGPFTG